MGKIIHLKLQSSVHVSTWLEVPDGYFAFWRLALRASQVLPDSLRF